MTLAAPAVRAAPSRLLDAAVVATCGLTLLLCAAYFGAGDRWGVVAGAFGALVVAWFAIGRRAVQCERRGEPFLVVLVAVCLVGSLVTPGFATFQILAYPLAWIVSAGFATALVANLGVTVGIGIGYAVGTSVAEAVGVQAASFAFSMAMGYWITRIEQRSEERQRLVEQLTAAQEQVAALSRDAGAVIERERIARELHDTLAQSLTGIVMLAERVTGGHPSDPTLPVLEDAARQALAEVRALVTDGAPVSLAQGLPAAVGSLAERFRRETGLTVDAAVSGDVPRGLEVVLLRCAQEGLANVRKHSGAGRVALRIDRQGAEAVLTVADDGRGPGHGTGFGLDGMRDRLALVGGRLELAAGPAVGAVLTVRVPVEGGR